MNKKTSLLIPSQLPEFIRDDASYQKFTLFLQAYYEWLELQGNALNGSQNLTEYWDVDTTTDQFLDYFYNDFLPYFPKDILADKKKVTKIARELYKTKGTPASYQFLFRVLYNSDVDFFYTKDAVLRASAGKWYVAKSLKLATIDSNFLSISNLRVFGETTKSIATIENSVRAGNKTEVFISNIERLFQSGEIVRVVDANNQDVLFAGEPLRAKIVGQISQIKINPKYRGGKYKPQDPVIVYGGLNSANGHGATAEIGTTTTGSISRILVKNGGYGYTPDISKVAANTPNTSIVVSSGGVYGSGVVAVIGDLLTQSANAIANVTFVPADNIGIKGDVKVGDTNYFFSNIAVSNSSTTLANAFTFISFSAYPISSVLVSDGGGGISVEPPIRADSTYPTEYGAVYGNLKNLGILAPIQITNPGVGYVANDKINILGGSGYGAYANVATVAANGAILTVGYVYSTLGNPQLYPLGGMGYRSTGLPSLTVTSANVSAANAVLYVPGILGDGAVFSTAPDRIGEITTINILDNGEDYVSAPNVSIKVQDIVASNIISSGIAQSGDIIYQGDSYANSSYSAVISSVNVLYEFYEGVQSLYNVRVYDYNSIPNYNLPLKIEGKPSINMVMSNQLSVVLPLTPRLNDPRYDAATGILTYGDGTAKANASFLNGLVVSQGQYLDTTGQPSSYDVLQSEVYNNFTYQITLEKEIEKYRSALINLLHPTGMKVLGRFAMKSDDTMDTHISDALDQGHTLGYYTGNPGSYAVMNTDFTVASTNIVKFYGLSGANLENIISTNNTLLLSDSNGQEIHSEVISITKSVLVSDYISVKDSTVTPNSVWYARNSTDGGNNLGWNFTTNTAIQDIFNTVILKDNVWLTFANVATITANAGSNTINITTITDSYNIINNGVYTNPAYPIIDIVRAGDLILVANNTQRTVQSVDYTHNKITLTTNLSSNANSFLSVNRTINTTGVPDGVKIFGPVGTQYFPEITTEAGDSLLTELGDLILLG